MTQFETQFMIHSMIEIVGGVVVGSFLLTWSVALYFFYRKIKPQFDSKSFHNLNANLRSVELFWSNKDSDFSKLVPGCQERDKLQAFQSFFLITTLCSLVSVAGFFLFFLVLLTGKSRREKLVFQSALVQEAILETEKVERIVQNIKNYC